MNKEFGFALEGECFVGKSETLRSMQAQAEREIYVVPEYFEVGRLSSSSRKDLADIRRIQDEIVGMERKRTDMAVSFLANHPTATLGFDRSYLSCLAFEQSVREKGHIDGYGYLLEKLIMEFEGGNIILPIQVIHLTAKPKTIEMRKSAHLRKGHDDVSEWLRDLEVRQIQNKFINKKGTTLYGKAYCQIPTDNTGQGQVAKICLKFICCGDQSVRVNLHTLYEQQA